MRSDFSLNSHNMRRKGNTERRIFHSTSKRQPQLGAAVLQPLSRLRFDVLHGGGDDMKTCPPKEEVGIYRPHLLWPPRTRPGTNADPS